MERGEEMLEALQAYRIKPGRALQFVDSSDNNARRLVLEHYPAEPSCYRVSYRDYRSDHNRLSGVRTTQISWRTFYIFSANIAYVCETTSSGHTAPALPSKRELKLLASQAKSKKLPPNFTKATDTQIASLWADLKVWTRL